MATIRYTPSRIRAYTERPLTQNGRLTKVVKPAADPDGRTVGSETGYAFERFRRELNMRTPASRPEPSSTMLEGSGVMATLAEFRIDPTLLLPFMSANVK